MGDGEATMAAMVKFIQDEARQKVQEVDAQAEQQYKQEKTKILQEMNDKANKEFTTHMKKIETQRAIQRSTSINKARLSKVAERSKYLDKATEGVSAELVKLTQDQRKYKDLLTKLIAQGCLKLLEPTVEVRCRAVDRPLVEGCLNDAEALYLKTLQQQAQKSVPLKLTIDAKPLPPPPGRDAVTSCMGGVVLVCHKGLITVDNTLDTRLRLVIEQDKPSIRKALFPR
jgi:V-type H+-transporting ATPase subunit E